jgi:uncharacterized protein YwqG
VSSIRELLTQHGLSRIADQIEAAAKPSIYLTSGEESEDPTSRLGGRPNLPKQMKWPVWKRAPLPFVAQLDLAEIPKIEGLPLPSSGSLHFFYEGGETAWGFQSKDKGSAQVIYTPGSLSEYPLHDLPEGVPDELEFTGLRLEPGPNDVSLPDISDQLVEELHMTPDERGKYYEFLEAWRMSKPATFHRVGGYPEPIQGDPKLEAQLVTNGLYCGDPTGYKRGEELGLYPGSADWELLLQVDSDDAANMMWGDVGRIYFLIRRQDLLSRAFENVWLVFQCS